MKNMMRSICKGLMASVGTAALAASIAPALAAGSGGGGAAGSGAAAGGAASAGTARPATRAAGVPTSAATVAAGGTRAAQSQALIRNGLTPNGAAAPVGGGGMPLTAVGTPASATANITTGQGSAATSLPNTVNGPAASQLRSRIGNAPSPLGNTRYGRRARQHWVRAPTPIPRTARTVTATEQRLLDTRPANGRAFKTLR